MGLKDGNRKYGGGFSEELDAAKRVNQLCEELEIPEKNPGIGTMPHKKWKAKEKTSQYRGISWNKTHGKWHAFLCSKGRKTHGGSFSNELDAAKRVNQLCKGLGIPERNPGIGTMPHQQLKRKEKTSQYKGVSWYEREEKWYAKVQLKGKLNFGGSFIDELDAANSVNQLCKKLGIPEKNPGIGTMPNRQLQAKENKSQYKGVYWQPKRRKWMAEVRAKDGKLKYGGRFSDELDAAKRVNQLCEEMRIPEKNPGIGTMLHLPWKHSDNKTIGSKSENLVMGSAIAKPDDNDGTKEKNFISDDQSAFKEYYFYDDLLK